MSKRTLCGAVIALLALAMTAACDGRPSTVTSASGQATSPRPSTSSSSGSPSPSSTAGQNEMMLQAAQSQFVKYYKAYLVEGKHPTHAPSKRLLAMTHPDGAERRILKESFESAREQGTHIESADVSISVGLEGKSNGTKRTELKFKACIDGRKAKVGDGERSRNLPWELLDVDMMAKTGASREARATEPSSWLVYSANQLDKDSPCEL